MANGAMEVYGALEKNKNLEEQVKHKPGQCNVETKRQRQVI